MYSHCASCCIREGAERGDTARGETSATVDAAEPRSGLLSISVVLGAGAEVEAVREASSGSFEIL